MRNAAAVFGAALGALLVGHNVGDHIAQTDDQAAHKAESWSAMAGHIGSYHAVQLGALASLRLVGVRPSARRIAAGLAFSAITHAWLDRRWPVAAVLRATGSPAFAKTLSPICGPYVADQALHHAALFVSALIIAAKRGRS